MAKTFDFGGWATKNNIRCSDGRTIRNNAFKDCDGQTVPLVWNHQHNDPENVLGHALLECREDGVYTYGSFNDTERGQAAKSMLAHGDITALSIYANQLKQNGGDVIHGVIREVSLVLAGANPGAMIDTIAISHGDDSTTDAIIYTGEELCHADEAAEKKENEEMAEETKKPSSDRTVGDVYDTLNEEQKQLVNVLVGKAVEDAKAEMTKKNDEGDADMKHNVFDNDTERNTLSHADMAAIFADGKRFGSLKESFLAHTSTGGDSSDEKYGIENLELLFPDDKATSNEPIFIKREDSWVSEVMGSVHHTPFSRTKSLFADITEDDARAKGYIKGKYKKEEVFSLLKRSTAPTTIYKKQKMDRDDIIDIADFNVVAWLKKEMRMMLDEEIARAILIGDGRLTSSDDHIDANCIRPIYTDDPALFTVPATVTLTAADDEDAQAKKFIKTCIKARKDYKGSGNPTLFTTETILTAMLLIEDGIGRRLYESETALATALRVKKIVTVPVMEGIGRMVDSTSRSLLGIIVNLADYNVGADKGGAVSMFDDFDIDYNQQKYLIETRCSGALVKPFSAIIVEGVMGE